MLSCLLNTHVVVVSYQNHCFLFLYYKEPLNINFVLYKVASFLNKNVKIIYTNLFIKPIDNPQFDIDFLKCR